MARGKAWELGPTVRVGMSDIVERWTKHIVGSGPFMEFVDKRNVKITPALHFQLTLVQYIKGQHLYDI